MSECEAVAGFTLHRREGQPLLCLRAFTSGKKYPDAQDECAQHDAKLATAKTRTAINFLSTLLPGEILAHILLMQVDIIGWAYT